MRQSSAANSCARATPAIQMMTCPVVKVAPAVMSVTAVCHFACVSFCVRLLLCVRACVRGCACVCACMCVSRCGVPCLLMSG